MRDHPRLTVAVALLIGVVIGGAAGWTFKPDPIVDRPSPPRSEVRRSVDPPPRRTPPTTRRDPAQEERHRIEEERRRTEREREDRLRAERQQKAREAEEQHKAVSRVLGGAVDRAREMTRRYSLSLGYLPGANEFRVEDASRFPDPEVKVEFKEKHSVVFRGSLAGQVASGGSYKSFIFKEIPQDTAVVKTHTYSTVYFEKGLRGTVTPMSYTAVIVDGPMEGTIVCSSYVNILLNGTFNGEITRLSYKDVHLAEGVLSKGGNGKIIVRASGSEASSPEISIHGYATANEILDLVWVTDGRGGEPRSLRHASAPGAPGNGAWFAKVVVKVDDFELGPGKHLIGNEVKVPVVARSR